MRSCRMQTAEIGGPGNLRPLSVLAWTVSEDAFFPRGREQDGSSRRLPGISRNPTLFDMEQAYMRASPVIQW